MDREQIKSHYKKNKQVIESRLLEFEQLRDASDHRLFQELVFVILTSQTTAEDAWEAATELEQKNLLIEGNQNQVAEVLRQNGVSYEDNKASYIVENRKNLSQPTLSDPSASLKLSRRIDSENLHKTREQLVDDIKGISWKGGSHFLRNIGYGNGFAIISGYISKSLYKLEIKQDPDQPSGKEEYIELERRMNKFADDLGIDIKALDLVLWSMETGEVFK